MINISGTDLASLITSYSVHRADVDSDAGMSETGVEWRQRARNGKASVTAGFVVTEEELALIGTLIAPASFTMTYRFRGGTATGQFRVVETDESIIGSESLWKTEIVFEEY